MKQLLSFCSIIMLATLACSLSSNDQTNEQNAAAPTQLAANDNSNSPTATTSPLEIVETSDNSGQSSDGCTPRTEWFRYVVVRGDTLFSIAGRADSSVDELTAANCLDDPTQISSGQTLYVPNEIAAGEEPRSSNELVKIFLIILDDNGASGLKVGCNDSAIEVWQDREKSGDTATDLQASLEELFSIRTSSYGQSGLVHSLAHTDVTVNSVSITGDTATIDLSGDFLFGGVCAAARVEAQIFLTIFQYDGLNQASVTVNGSNLKQWFDMSGRTGDDEPYRRSDFGYLE